MSQKTLASDINYMVFKFLVKTLTFTSHISLSFASSSLSLTNIIYISFLKHPVCLTHSVPLSRVTCVLLLVTTTRGSDP